MNIECHVMYGWKLPYIIKDKDGNKIELVNEDNRIKRQESCFV